MTIIAVRYFLSNIELGVKINPVDYLFWASGVPQVSYLEPNYII